MIDCGGESHQFHFQLRLLGDRVALDAFELRGDIPTDYRFQPDASNGTSRRMDTCHSWWSTARRSRGTI
ncbi:DUF7686 domain-containing protein [Paraburkholderia azotifigens]|uniref:DUF7686 domain-containing protein n=1 Tax=Paraburkholderia azotifigens TaxID=2057004 RepID=UPI003B8A6368